MPAIVSQHTLQSGQEIQSDQLDSDSNVSNGNDKLSLDFSMHLGPRLKIARAVFEETFLAKVGLV